MGKTFKNNDEYSKKWANKRKNVVNKKIKNKFVRQIGTEGEESNINNITDLRQWNG